MPVRSFNLHTIAKLTPVGKEYTYFQIDGKYAQAAKCVKSRITTKVIDCVLSIHTHEQKCVVIKVMLQSPRLKSHMRNIGIAQLLINSALFNIDVFKTSINYTNILGSVTTNNNSKIFLTPRSPMTPPTLKKPIDRK